MNTQTREKIASSCEAAVRKAFALKFKGFSIDSIVFPELSNSSECHVRNALMTIGLGGLTCCITVGDKQLKGFVQQRNDLVDGLWLDVVGFIYKNSWVSSPESLNKVLAQ
jgi:hypothetical protein